MGILKDDLARNGYNQEEAYFYKLNRELVDKLKQKAKLKLIKGGKSDETGTSKTEDKEEHEHGQGRKAA